MVWGESGTAFGLLWAGFMQGHALRRSAAPSMPQPHALLLHPNKKIPSLTQPNPDPDPNRSSHPRTSRWRACWARPRGWRRRAPTSRTRRWAAAGALPQVARMQPGGRQLMSYQYARPCVGKTWAELHVRVEARSWPLVSTSAFMYLHAALICTGGAGRHVRVEAGGIGHRHNRGGRV